MHHPLRTISMVGLITLSLNAWADTAGGFDSILQSAASGPATQAGKLPAAGAAIKGLPANLGGQKSTVLPAATSPGTTDSQHPLAPALSAHPKTSSAPAKTPAATATGARSATVSHPPMGVSTPRGLAPQQHIGAPMSAVNPEPRQKMPQTISEPSALPTPTTLPLRSQSRRQNPAATGYVNPFVGQPGVIERLSNRLAVIKLNNEITKARATGAKYHSEYATLSQDNSPQMQALAQSMSQMKAHLAQLESRQTEHVSIVQANQLKKANPSMVLVGILHNDGDKYALLQLGKRLLTLSKGATAGNSTIQSIGTDSIQLTNGDQLRVSSNGVGHYAATSWKGTQAGGGIIPPQSSVSAGLMNEARQAGIPLPGAEDQQPANAGTQMIHFPTPGMRP